MATIPKGPDLCYARGDTVALSMTFKRNKLGIDLTGFTGLLLSVDSTENPTNTATQVAQFTGTLDTDPTTGRVEFRPPDQVTSDAYVPGTYFYDVQGVNADSEKVTFLKGGSFEIIQDITKA